MNANAFPAQIGEGTDPAAGLAHEHQRCVLQHGADDAHGASFVDRRHDEVVLCAAGANPTGQDLVHD